MLIRQPCLIKNRLTEEIIMPINNNILRHEMRLDRQKTN